MRSRHEVERVQVLTSSSAGMYTNLVCRPMSERRQWNSAERFDCHE